MRIKGTEIKKLRNFIDTIESQTYPETQTELHTQLSENVITTIFKEFPNLKQEKILDIGCGQGVALEIFNKLGCSSSNLTGIALNKEDVDVCKQAGHNVIQMDQSFLEFSNQSFGYIWCRHCIEHSIFPLFTLSEFYRVLSDDGFLYIEVPMPGTVCHHETNPNHYSVFTKESWEALFLKSNFQIISRLTLPIDLTIGKDEYWGCILKKNKK